jgi:hypothetical protein
MIMLAQQGEAAKVMEGGSGSLAELAAVGSATLPHRRAA